MASQGGLFCEGSQASQDRFVLGVLRGKTDGFYLEVGAANPVHFSNTYRLELLGWSGISIEKSPEDYAPWVKERKHPLIIADSRTVDYDSLGVPALVDYLSFDTNNEAVGWERPYDNGNRRFSVVTLEHNSYIVGNRLRDEQRFFLGMEGMVLVCGDVKHCDRPFEDWYLSEALFNSLGCPAAVESLEHDVACDKFLAEIK